MSPLAVLGIVAASTAALALAVVLVRFNRKRLCVARCAATLTPEQLERIYSLVEQTGTTAANGYVLARTNKATTETRCLVPIPKELPQFPWAGRVVEATVSNTVELQFVEATAFEPSLLGHVYRPVQVPRHATKSSTKERNTFSPERYVADSAALSVALSTVCPKYPTELLSYLLCVGRESFEFEPIDQARIGTSPAWVQDPEHQICDECQKRMHLVLQLPGTLISRKAFHRGTFYLFGCVTHPDRTKTLGQFT
ncbi:hypothetical protein QRD43_06420 [Pelomonas sp. APW6]|uniref:Uncharacterized protein n=1 Tax=Roseateles subflavus TaxID=3053353 RepID=A0ABT7LGI8_9BURK|nr:hypothetical protein [Pelomonas sp. APW6]MDL5031539.1 hypothetical protein [Pelomonas sp. APW6]